MKGYKAFNKGMTCLDKQYQEHTDYEENGTKICNEGMMHFCEEPFDVLDYYLLVNDNGDFSEFAEVEAPDELVVREGNKCASTKIHIGAKLKFKDFIDTAVNVVIEKTKGVIGLKDTDLNDSGNNYAKIGSSGYGAKIGSSGDYAQIGSSGYGAKIGSSGDYAQIGSSGDYAQIGSSGDGAKIGSSGDGAKIKVLGKNSVAMCAGYNCAISAELGCWITLAEWKYNHDENKCIPVCVKSAQIDGEILKPGVAYKLEDGEFVEVDAE